MRESNGPSRIARLRSRGSNRSVYGHRLRIVYARLNPVTRAHYAAAESVRLACQLAHLVWRSTRTWLLTRVLDDDTHDDYIARRYHVDVRYKHVLRSRRPEDPCR